MNLEGLARELKFATRALAKRPGFTLIVLITLALGIGANAAIFSVVDAVLLQPLPYAEPQRLVRVWSAFPGEGVERGTTSPLDLDDWRLQANGFAAIAGYPAITLSGLVITGDDAPDEVRAMHVTEDFFEVFGVEAAVGRTLAAADQRDGDNRVAVLSHAAWRQRFAADAGVVGDIVTLNGEPFTIVGVMPPTFEYPVADVELWVPVSLIPDTGIPRIRPVRWMNVVARLADGVSIEQARAEMQAVVGGLAEEYPDTNSRLTDVTIAPLRDQVIGDVRPAMLTVFAAVGFVLLIACANVANLVLARSDARSTEIAVRAALGASRGRLLAQVLAESVLLALLGGMLGLGVARVALQFLIALAPGSIPRLGEISLDGNVLVFSFVLSLLTGVLFGGFPALRISLRPPGGSLRSPVVGSDRAGGRFRAGLVIAEIALVVVLAIGSGLLIRSYSRLLDVDTGFDADNVLTLRVSARATDGYLDFLHDAVAAVRTLPGVEAAGMIRPLPLRGDTFQGEGLEFTVAGHPVAPGEDAPEGYLRFAGPGYFAAMGIPQLSGRDFRDGDDRDAEPVVIVSRSLAQRYWSDEDPVGSYIEAGGQRLRVVGMVGDVRQIELADEPAPALYVPHRQVPRTGMTIVVRSDGNPAALVGAIQEEIWALRADQPIEDIASMDAVIGASVEQPRFAMALLSLFAALALGLASVGVYGVISYTVGLRSREIALRIALGARPVAVQQMVINGAARLAVAGVGLGLVIAAAASTGIESQLFGVTATDWGTFTTVAALLFTISVAASVAPALRASSQDPSITLRSS